MAREAGEPVSGYAAYAPGAQPLGATPPAVDAARGHLLFRHSITAHAHGLKRMDVNTRPCDAPAMPPRLPTDSALGRAIRQLREQRGLTQEELATHAGMTFGTVSRLESAKSAPAWATVRALIDTLDVSLGDLARAVEAQEHAK